MKKVQFIIIGEYEIDEERLAELYGSDITTVEEAASVDRKSLVEGDMTYEDLLNDREPDIIFRVLD